MLREKQNKNGKNVDIQYKTAVAMKRGTVVKKDYVNKTIVKANELDGEIFIVDRDILPDDGIMTRTLSDYEDILENIPANEFAQLKYYDKGERFMISEYTGDDSTLKQGTYLAVDNGKAKAVESGKSIWISLGIIDDNGHKLLGIEVIG